jgi:hypothetical protein
MLTLSLPADVQQYLEQEVAMGKYPSEADLVVVAVRRFRDSNGDMPQCREHGAEDHQDVLNWDNLIPVPPERPGGRICVNLKSAGRDRPLPAENPWAE